jgi:splicing factor 3B subunit 4
MNGQFLSGKQITVSYAFKKDSKERHGDEAERLLAGKYFFKKSKQPK